MGWKRASQQIADFLEKSIEHLHPVKRKMFGNPAYFVNDNLFTGVFGDELFLRFSADDRDQLIAENDEASQFDPMGGRPMKEYVVIPESIYNHPQDFDKWLQKSYNYTASLPPKVKKKK